MNRKDGMLEISALDEPGAELGEMVRDVRAGLSTVPQDLSPWPKYFYDAEGSRLFQEITKLPEYYQTRAESSILQERAREIVSRTLCRELVELGSGSSSKTRALLDAMLESGRPARYVPLDVSESTMEESGRRLLSEYPGLEIRGYVGDFDKSLGKLLGCEDGSGERLMIFLGGTIGNFSPRKRREFLAGIRAGLHDGDYLLVGVDLVKDPEVLEAAYDDASGVTARFNKNLLKVLNERLRAGFDLDLFTHRAVYNAAERRVEMWLDSQAEQAVELGELNLEVRFERGEGLRTEISAKFTRREAEGMLEEAGFVPAGWYPDKAGLFGLVVGEAGA